VSPDDPDHVERICRFLRSLTFRAAGESFRCERSDLIRLGRAYDKRIQDDGAALAAGTNQFKINPDQLQDEWKDSTWVQENVLIAVAVGSRDGTSGLQGDASLATLRKEIERSSHIILSSQPSQREFWLGRGSVRPAQLEAEADWGGLKPCLHGSDAHDADAVAMPALDRRCWIKGDLEFESLRQACLEPETRTFIGPVPPHGALPSQVVSSLTVTDAPWLKTGTVPLNRGLVAIIGARGSGKTALAEGIAAGGFAVSPHLSERSFIRRAKEHLGDSAAVLTWEAGDPTSNELRNVELDFFDVPRVQYLSQQFVDTLCSAEGLTDELLAEVERVIYQAHDPEDRMGTTSFRELLDLRAARGRSIRERYEEALLEASANLTAERERRASLQILERRRKDMVASIDKDKRDRSTLIGRGSEERTKRRDEVSTAAEAVRFHVEQTRRQRQALLVLKDEVYDIRTNKAPAQLRRLQQTHQETRLSQVAWKDFLLDFVGDVDGTLTDAIKFIEDPIRALGGPAAGEVVVDADAPASTVSLLPRGADLTKQTLSLLDKEVVRLRKLIGIDTEKAKAFGRLTEKISREEAALAKLDREIEIAGHADENIKELIELRRDCYASIFEGIIDEEKELSGLYEPLKARLMGEGGALGKLSFSVRRAADIETWAKEGESLLDLRKAGPFRGQGALLDAAKAPLLSAWECGSADDVAEAMARFREAHERGLLEHLPVNRSDAQAVGDWASKVSLWLYGTKHIRVTYGIQYEGVDIERLSPGTRGIVLLLLYLAIDRDDDRPLIIDQPEENLDPKSVFDELVERFRMARLHRQIIIVTHNANLVVNTDADQVIVAKCGPHKPGELPEISYESGGLENSDIRCQVVKFLKLAKQPLKS
jgi:hypothetical protein